MIGPYRPIGPRAPTYDDDDLEVSDKDIDRMNDNKEEDRPNNTKE